MKLFGNTLLVINRTSVTLFLVASATTCAAGPLGAYSKDQAQAGAEVYGATCASCHGAHLQGGAAPALTGPTFAKSIESTLSTMSTLLKFISTQMPVNNPGSLSAEQYTQVLAFILASNHHPAAEAASGTPSLNEVSLLPYPDGAVAKTTDPNLEIQNIGGAQRLVIGSLPDKSAVNVGDRMLHSVESHPSDWLLSGRDYSNQR